MNACSFSPFFSFPFLFFFFTKREGKRYLTSHLPLEPTQVTVALWFEEGGGLSERHGG